MPNHDREQEQVDAVIAEMRRASALQLFGWTLLIFDGLIIAMWLFVGYRSGSNFWLYWFVVEGVIGSALVLIGSHLKTRAGRHISRLDGDDVGRRVA
ncbi:MAG TPA: hypothetical protein VD837_09720 [Terriglobales bacterium]|nr:hypothetical protein [Terriglobales bacterium]